MAKKKMTHQPQDPKLQPHDQQTQPQQEKQEPTMEDREEKLQNLKSLNSLLLKETIEKRQQLESLIQAKEALEAELSKFGEKRIELESELSVESDKRVSLEIERDLFGVFIETQMREMGVCVDGFLREKGEKESEIGVLKGEVKKLMANLESEREKLGQACHERDVLRGEFDVCVKKANRMREKIVEMEKLERKSEERFEKLKAEYGLLFEERKETENEIEELKKLKDLAEKRLLVRVKEIENLMKETEGVVREKRNIEMERDGERVKISGLEREVCELNKILSTVRKEERVLRNKVLELERNCREMMEKEKTMGSEIGALMEEKKDKERIIEMLREEKHRSEQCLQMVNADMRDKSSLIEKLLREKNEIEEVKAAKEDELVEMHKEVDRVREVVLSSQESVKALEERNKQLAFEVGQYRDAIERVTLERDSAQCHLDDERKKGKNLGFKVLEKEKSIEKNVEEYAKVKNELENLIEEKKEVESQISFLRMEKDSVHHDLLSAQREIDDLRAKIESAAINSKRVLTVLKNTAVLVCQSNDGKDDMVVNDNNLEDEIEPYETELEVIKNAFMNKEAVVEEMKQQVESLHRSVAKANEKKSFWTIVSSVTTVFAALSLAYVARLR